MHLLSNISLLIYATATGLGRGRSSDRGSTRSDGGSGRSQEGRDRSYGDHCGSGTRRHDEQRRSNDRTLPPERPRSRVSGFPLRHVYLIHMDVSC